MKLRSIFFPAVLSIVFMAFGACSGDDSDEPDDANMGCADFAEEYQVAVNAAMAYSQNPTTENCEAFKSAWLQFYEEYSDCPLWGEEYEEDLQEVQQMDCSAAEAE